MVIEHIFVTTQKPEVAIPMIGNFLFNMGFENSFSPSPTDQSQWTSLQMRMSPQALKHYGLKKVKAMLNLEYDRGRITMAVSINAKRESFTVSGNDSPSSKAGFHMFKFASEICLAIECLTSRDGTPEAAARRFALGRDEISSFFKTQSRNRKITYGLLLFLFITAIALIVLMNS